MCSSKNCIFLCLIFLVVCNACNQPHNTDTFTRDSLAEVAQAKLIRSFYNYPQKQEFRARCITCHSLRYIETQPNFSRETWEKIVEKMSKNFGASIPDTSAKMIVDYLMEIKGND